MRSTTIIAAVSMGLALTACGTKNETTTDANISADLNATGSMTDGNMTATAAALPAQGFVDTIAASDMFEIQSGKLAATMGSSAAVKSFGQMLVTDHEKASTMLKEAGAKTSPVVALPMILPADLKAKITALKATSGAAFDALFVSQQIEGHQKALDALEAYAAGGDQESLKSFAATSAPIVEGHLTQLRALPN